MFKNFGRSLSSGRACNATVIFTPSLVTVAPRPFVVDFPSRQNIRPRSIDSRHLEIEGKIFWVVSKVNNVA